MTASQWVDLLSVWPVVPLDWMVFADFLEEQGRDEDALQARRVSENKCFPQAHRKNATLEGKEEDGALTWWCRSAFLCEMYINAPDALSRENLNALVKPSYANGDSVWRDGDFREYRTYEDAMHALAQVFIY